MADFGGGLIASMLQPKVADLGKALQPVSNAVIRRGAIDREADLLAEENLLRDDAAESVALLQQPVELRRQALNSQLIQAQRDDDQEEIQGIQQALQMDDVGLDTMLKEAAFKGAKYLPPGVLQGLSGGRRGNIKAVEGDMTFIDDDGVIFSQQTFMDPNSQTSMPGLTDISGQNKKPVGQLRPINKMGQTSAQVMTDKARTAGKVEQAKADVQLKTRPEVERLIKMGRARGDEDAQNKIALDNMEANLPVLKNFVGDLKKLGRVATYTKGGRAFDALARELGLKVPKGATARAKYQAMIDNQVLPLLKATFGAAFTVSEGDKLSATLGDINLSPDEKDAALDAFIEQKMVEVDVTRGKVQRADQRNAPAAVAPSGKAETDEELMKRYGI